MRSAKVWIPLAILLGLVFALSAQAGGKGAVKADLYEASVYMVTRPDGSTIPRILADGEVAGFVVFAPTGSDKMEITVKLEDGPAKETFQVRVAPGAWNSPADLTLTTNGQGKGTVHIGLPIPESFVAAGVAPIKVTLAGDDVDFATDSRDPPFVNPPHDPSPSTLMQVDLK